MDNVIAVELLTGWFGLGFIAALIYFFSPDRRYGYGYFPLLLLALCMVVCITILGPIGAGIVIYGERKYLTTSDEP